MRVFSGFAVALLTACGLLAACGDSSGLAATAPGGAAGDASKAVCTTQMAGAPLTPDQLARMIAVRQKFFGAANVDALTGAPRADRVMASWISVSGYALAINGQVVLLDAFVGNNSGNNYIPTDDCELSDLRATHQFIGHGHVDHAQLAATLANRSRNMVTVGSAQLCADLATSLMGLTTPQCVEATAREATPGTVRQLAPLIPGVQITTLRHLHSDAGAPANPTDPSIGVPVPAFPKPVGAGPCTNCPAPTSPDAVVMATNEDGEVSVLYQFRLGDFVLTWNNTNGPNTPGDATLTAMSQLPQTDVELGSILGFNVFANGFLDARNIAEALRTRLLVPNHHDFIGPYEGRSYEMSLRMEFDKTPADKRPGIAFVSDPVDYLNAARLTWNPQAAVWKDITPVSEAMAKP